MNRSIAKVFSLFFLLSMHFVHADVTLSEKNAQNALFERVAITETQRASKKEPLVETEIENTPTSSRGFHITSQHTGESTETYFWRMILTLVAIVILLFLTLWLFRRIGRGKLGGKFGGGTSIKVLERRGLSPKSALYLVEIGNKRVLLAESQVHVESVTTIESQMHEHPHLEQK